MERSQKSAFVFGLLAALFWSPHFPLFRRIAQGQQAPPTLVLSFYFVLGGAVALVLLLFLGGRLAELRVFGRRETYFLLLAAAGGYGFWVLRSLTLESLEPTRARLVFYSVPLLMAVLGAFTRERPDGRAFFGLLLGFVGCIMLVAPGDQVDGGVRGVLLGLAAAGCWAAFSLAARPLARQEKAIPVAAVVTGIGAICLLVTCLSTRESVFQIRPGELATALVGGAFTVGFMMALWLKCLAGAAAVLAGGMWYFGLVFGVLWTYVGFGGVRPDPWWLLGGTVLVLLGVHSTLSGRRRKTATMSDIIRGS
ncbi:MAG: DMT family transporter [Candidatus Brocadiaceae bacterium]|jgi:drug/metabolite transporter (DMT)-like permease